MKPSTKRFLKVNQVRCVCMILVLVQGRAMSAPQLQRAGVPASMKTMYATLRTMKALGFVQSTVVDRTTFYTTNWRQQT